MWKRVIISTLAWGVIYCIVMASLYFFTNDPNWLGKSLVFGIPATLSYFFGYVNSWREKK